MAIPCGRQFYKFVGAGFHARPFVTYKYFRDVGTPSPTIWVCILSAKKPPQTKNAQEGYKTYAQRKEEAAQLSKNETTEEQPLPKLQSFEDVNKKGEWKD